MGKRTVIEEEDFMQQAEVEIEMCLDKHQNLSEEEMEEIKAHIKLKTYKKGSILLREGECTDKCYSVFKGCVRQYYLVDGEEKTTFFYTTDQTIFGTSNQDQSVPSKYYLECIEDSVLSITTPESQKVIYAKIPKFEPMARAAMVDELAKYQQMLADYIMRSPEQRYTTLIKERPELLNKVPQHQLASYLGVKPESLSRIRKRITQKQVRKAS